MNSAKIDKFCCHSSIRNFQFAITIRFTTFSWETQSCYACSCHNKEPWGSHSTAICKQWGAKCKRTTHIRCQKCSDLQLQNRISTSKRKNVDFEARFNRNFNRKINTARSGKNLLAKHHSHDPTEGLPRDKPRPTEIAILLQFRTIHAHDPTWRRG